MKLKFCGMRRSQDIAACNAFPPDYIGFVFAHSRRQVTAAQARALTRQLNGGIATVGVFVNEPLERLFQIAREARLAVLQLHGDESADYIDTLRKGWPGPVWKAVRVRTAGDMHAAAALPVDALLLDAFSPTAYGGTGKTADLALIAANRPQKPFFLAGGLHAENVRQAIEKVRPDGIDLSGGIETGGVKDAAKIQQIHTIIRGASCRQMEDSGHTGGNLSLRP